MILGDLNFEENPEFKVLSSFQGIFNSTKLEIRNDCKTWIFNITDQETINMLKNLKFSLNTKFFKNFLMEIDVSLIIDLEKMLIIITHEKVTKYKTFIELARHVGKLFEILKYINIQKNAKMLDFLKHYAHSSNKSMLIFQIPLSSEHLNQNIKAVSFIINCPTNIQKMESQSSASLSMMIYPSFAQSFLVCSLKRDITSIGITLESLSRSADTLVEFNEYIMGRILYPSIMDGEDKYNLTFITRTKDEMCIYYRDYFALDIVFPDYNSGSVYYFHIYDKYYSSFYLDSNEINTNIHPIPTFETLKKKIDGLMHEKTYRSDNKFIEFKCQNLSMFHVAFKLIFDYLGCLYVISKLQNESFKMMSLEDNSQNSPDKFLLEFDRNTINALASTSQWVNTSIMPKSISIDILLSKKNYTDEKILVKSENSNKYNISPENELKNCL